MAILNKKLEITVPILIVVIISVLVTTFMMNNNKSTSDIAPPEQSEPSTETTTEDIKMGTIYVEINNEKYELALEDNQTTKALLVQLPLNLIMQDLNGNEKYANLSSSLPEDPFIPGHIEAGDVMLYGDDSLVIFYKSFDTEYGYTKIGHIANLEDLGDGDISVTLTAK